MKTICIMISLSVREMVLYVMIVVRPCYIILRIVKFYGLKTY